LIGTTYGGNGTTTFALPDLRSRVPIHQGQLPGGGNYVVGTQLGTETVALTTPTMPGHSHTVMAASAASSATPSGNTYGGGQGAVSMYVSTAPGTAMAATMVGNSAGGGVAHNNIMPCLAIRFIICAFGIFPVRS
jgi:microcystin-dependent protein